MCPTIRKLLNANVSARFFSLFYATCILHLVTTRMPYSRITAPECYSSSTGEDYRGRLAVTVNGNICQMWSRQRQHLSESGIDPHNPSLEENYCRNPDPVSRSRPWCLVLDETTFGITWEFCDVAPCQGGTLHMHYICHLSLVSLNVGTFKKIKLNS